MLSQIRKIVAGPKKRTVTQNFDLDFTYITQTVVAMAYPASGLQQTYRNPIDDVSKYLQTHHNNNYLIINVSNRKYSYKPFNNKVKDYLWQDHQAPTLDVLYQVCSDSYQFLKQQQPGGVVCFHCNHGKGRTGTSIICLFIYAGFFDDVSEAVRFYNKKRFQGENYGVSQPCQIRYMNYFLSSFKDVRNNTYSNTLKAYKMVRIEHQGLIDSQYEVSVYLTRDMIIKYNKVQIKKSITKIEKGEPLISDIYIQVAQKGWTGGKVIARANINLNYAFEEENKAQLKWQMFGSKVRISKSHSPNFAIYFYFQQFCKCHQKQDQQCPCQERRKIQQEKWQLIISLAKAGCALNSRDTCKLLFPAQVIQIDQEEQQMEEKKEEKEELKAKQDLKIEKKKSLQ